MALAAREAELWRAVEKLEPFLNDDHNYWGCYLEDIQELRRIMGWQQ